MRRRAGGQGKLVFQTKCAIPSGETKSIMTEEEQAEFMEKRCAALEEMLPLGDEEFKDEVEELTWDWARHLLPYRFWRRAKMAGMKRKIVLRQSDFFRKFRLFKPLSIKYPTLMKRLVVRTVADLEDNKFRLNPEWIANEERIAGFTYEDFCEETTRGEFKGWELPKVGELVDGKVVDFSDQGAFVDIGDKAWAFVPLDLVSLIPISNAEEVLSLGQIIQGRVVAEGGHSRLIGDEFVKHRIVSITDLESEKAWDSIEKIQRGEAEGDPLLKVTVQSMKTFGAVVMTEQGLEALIPNRELADRAGDTSLVGQTIKTQIQSMRPENRNKGQALGPQDFALYLSYKNIATMELASSLQEGQVLFATVKEIRDAFMDVIVEGAVCSIRKIDITARSSMLNLPELFEVGEEIKVYVISVFLETGEIRLSTRALERRQGEILDDKAGVFARAEATAKKYFEQSTKQQAQFEATLGDVLGGDTLGGDLPGGQKKAQGSVDLDDDDDDSDLGF